MKIYGRCMTCKETKECHVVTSVILKRTNKIKDYLRCNACHAANMRVVMRRRYATPEGRASMKLAMKRYYEKKKQAVL